MELFAGLMFLAAVFVGLLLMLKVSFWIIAFVVLPLFWLWMLIDAIARRDEDYPSKSTNEKILWIVLLLFVQVSAAVYWLVVYRHAHGRESALAASTPPQPQTAVPTPPPAV